MRTQWYLQSAPKAGMRSDENEDRAGCVREGRVVRAAVADGATESAYAGEWAQALVDGWLSAPPGPLSIRDALTIAHERFSSVSSSADELPWYGHAKVAQGAQAAMAWFELRSTTRGYRWACNTVGDCEVVLLSRHLRLRQALPMVRSSDFDSTPDLQISQTAPRVAVGRRYTGKMPTRGEIWLMTDALGQACLSADERRAPLWRWLAEATTDPDRFQAAVDEMREAGVLRNDDVTLVQIIT